MRFFSKAKDGGKDSPVDGYFLIEIKGLFSIVFLKFNKGQRESYHTHAFNALTWFLWGDLEEQKYNGSIHEYKRNIIPKITKRDNNHRVKANKNSYCISLRGRWASTWTEHNNINKVKTTFTHGRKVIAQDSIKNRSLTREELNAAPNWATHYWVNIYDKAIYTSLLYSQYSDDVHSKCRNHRRFISEGESVMHRDVF